MIRTLKEGRLMIEKYKGLTIDEIIHLLPEEQIRHSLNVEMLVETLIQWLPISPEYANSEEYKYFGRAAYYHDIGKVSIPFELITKPKTLTKEEYLMMRNHTVFAQELLQLAYKGEIIGIQKFMLPLIHDASVYHHEWWNGKGYPFGLSKEDIPFIARVTSICDSYDAMVSNRTYRKAYSHNYACGEIDKGTGTQFEPMLVKIFLDHESEISHLFDKSHAAG